ncbi:hypothetical protein [Allomesorhizobium camelthorni]|uniref:Uncharacterized protein n=1 Tax=Allomesorhizobium camelthorni TaxID=475069 RepID=A0A6G4W8E8_9HYPH|nr:hypothetical protein [Mesorhizobium camelthorni]NGO50598.1 hypothetical protein [Mesorhizobium camelthorni]
MSGPKVVRIITREEMIALCERLLAQFEAAMAEWVRIGRRNGTVDDGDIEAVAARGSALKNLLASDRFMDLQKQVAAEISYLASDTQVRLVKAADAETEKRKSARRLQKSAETLAVALGRAGRDIPTELAAVLKSGTLSRQQLEAAISGAMKSLMGSHSAGGISEHQRELANCLGEGERRLTFSEWASAQPLVDDDLLDSIDTHLAELSTLAGTDAAAAFEERAAAVAVEKSSRKQLLADSLLIDLAAATKQARDRIKLRPTLASLRKELEKFDSERARSLAQELDAVLGSGGLASAPLHIERAEAYLKEQADAAASRARRRAVLEGLSALGYDVREGMETAWVKDGRITMRKASDPGFGIEVGGNPGGNLQMRAVVFDGGAQRNTGRDIDMETAWCGEFSQLREMFATNGGEILIEKALAVGAVPLKVVASNTVDEIVAEVARGARHS